jgi:hypothetical protein
VNRGDPLRSAHALRQGRAQRHGVGEEFGQWLGSGLEVVRPAHGADAGGAIGERDQPEPAMGEPQDRDVALELAGQRLTR